MRMTSAVPATPAKRAIHPAWRPMTSTTKVRLWDWAVVWSLSMASVAVSTAVRNPKVMTVEPRSLSMVLGIPMTGRPLSRRRRAMVSEPSPPMEMRQSSPRFLNPVDDLVGPVDLDDGAVGLFLGPLHGIPPIRGPEDGPARVGDSLHRYRAVRGTTPSPLYSLSLRSPPKPSRIP